MTLRQDVTVLMKWLLVDVVLEFFNWLIDRKNYQKKTLEAIKFTGVTLLILFLVVSIGFLTLVLIHLKMMAK